MFAPQIPYGNLDDSQASGMKFKNFKRTADYTDVNTKLNDDGQQQFGARRIYYGMPHNSSPATQNQMQSTGIPMQMQMNIMPRGPSFHLNNSNQGNLVFMVF